MHPAMCLANMKNAMKLNILNATTIKTGIWSQMQECGIYDDIMASLQRLHDNASSLILNMDIV